MDGSVAALPSPFSILSVLPISVLYFRQLFEELDILDANMRLELKHPEIKSFARRGHLLF